jgi:hypothetical protein
VMMIRENLQTILGPTISVSAMLADNPIIRAGGKIPLIVQSPVSQSAALTAIDEAGASAEIAQR